LVLGPSFADSLINPAPVQPEVSILDAHLDVILGKPMSIGDILFSWKICKLELDEGKSGHVVKTISSFSFPVFIGHLVIKKQLTDLSVLVDPGASISFLNDKYVLKKKIVTNTLVLNSFDGSSKVSGDVVRYVDLWVAIPLVNGKFIELLVCFHVTRLSSADAILGSLWLKATNSLVGGVSNEVIINGGSVCFSSMADDNPGKHLSEKFSDVFVNQALSSLPPH
jgi:hypothetical protein